MSIFLWVIVLVGWTTKKADGQTEFYCENTQACKCVHLNSVDIFANCKSLQLNNTPKFQVNVTHVDLSNNNIVQFPWHGEFPTDVKYLDFSKNNLSYFANRPFQNMSKLEYLDLSENAFLTNTLFTGSGKFSDLINLKHLNIKSKFLNLSSGVYPKSLAKLTNLEVLRMYGVQHVSFDSTYLNLKKLKFLDLSGKGGFCNIVDIKVGYFTYISHIEHLNISFCKMRQIENGTFKELSKLKSLNISNNDHLSFRVLSNVTYDLQFTEIKHFDFSKIHCTFGGGTTLYFDDMKYLANTNISTLHFNSNRIVEIQQCVLSFLPKSLRYVSVRDNRFYNGRYMLESNTLLHLEIIDASDQYKSHDGIEKFGEQFNTCGDWRGAPPFLNLTCNSNETKIPFPIELPPMMEFVDVQSCYTKHAAILAIQFNKSNSMKKINARNNLIRTWIGPVINLVKMEYLDLSGNICAKVSSIFFSGFPNLKILLISNNLLGTVIKKDCLKDQNKTFEKQQKLQILDLSANRIQSFPTGIFSYLRDLQVLNLSDNMIFEWDVEIGNMKKLLVLDLSYNRIQTLNKTIRSDINKVAQNTKFALNMTGNRLSCSCDTLESLKWMRKRQTLFTNFGNYTCQFSNGTIISFFQLDYVISVLDKNCSSYTSLIIGIIFAISLTSIVLVGGLVYRFRWKMRYWYYMTKSRIVGYNRLEQNEDRQLFQYEAFIAYADDLTEFVNEVVENLEVRCNINLCFHHRNFLAGVDIAENITNAIHNSRKTVIILSRSFLKSYWCMFEFNMARMESIYSRGGENAMFVLMYENIPARDIPLSMMDILVTKAYIEYPNNTEGRLIFWKNLEDALKG